MMLSSESEYFNEIEQIRLTYESMIKKLDGLARKIGLRKKDLRNAVLGGGGLSFSEIRKTYEDFNDEVLLEMIRSGKVTLNWPVDIAKKCNVSIQSVKRWKKIGRIPTSQYKKLGV